jgi:RNA polymerase sigma-70 factor (ECF subfamily)
MQHPQEPEPEDPGLRISMSEYQAGSVEAFDRLHDALACDLRKYLTRLSGDPTRADDLLQETFLQIHRSRATHAPGQPVRPWVFAIAKRVFLMHRRRTARRLRHELRSGAEREPTEDSATLTERLHARQQVESLLRQAPREGRRAFLLHHLFGLSFAEVGARLRVKAAAAKVRSSRAATFMRALLRESGK